MNPPTYPHFLGVRSRTILLNASCFATVAASGGFGGGGATVCSLFVTSSRFARRFCARYAALSFSSPSFLQPNPKHHGMSKDTYGLRQSIECRVDIKE